MESLKNSTQSLLNVLEEVTKTGFDGEKPERATPEEVIIKFACISNPMLTFYKFLENHCNGFLTVHI